MDFKDALGLLQMLYKINAGLTAYRYKHTMSRNRGREVAGGVIGQAAFRYNTKYSSVLRQCL